MNRVVKIVIFIAILATFAGCLIGTMEENPAPVVPEGYIRTALNLQVAKSDSIQTRATDLEEKAYDESNVWVLLFKATSATDSIPTTLMQAPVRATKSGADLFVMLRSTALPVTIYVVAGLSTNLNNEMATIQEGATFAAVNTALQTATVTSAGVPIGAGSYFHMSSAKFYKDGTILLTKIEKQPLIRNVAKIDVDASAVSGDFTLEGVTLVNGAQKGYVFRQAAIPANHGGATVQYDEKTSVVGNMVTSQIYLYENAGKPTASTDNPTKLIIRGVYKGQRGYYRMDLVKRNEDGSYTPFDIQRNYCYTLKITKMETVGYLAPAEALAAPPSNTWYQVVIGTDDTTSHDIVSNGHYYLGVSNSEYFVYTNSGTATYLVVTVKTNAPAGTTTSIGSSGIQITSPTGLPLKLTPPSGTGTSITSTDISATVPDLNPGHYIEVRVGNLTKRITVQRRAGTGSASGELADFSQENYVSGRVASANYNKLRLAITPGEDFIFTGSVNNASLVNPQGGFYINYSGLTATTNAVVHLSKANNEGRAKIIVNR